MSRETIFLYVQRVRMWLTNKTQRNSMNAAAASTQDGRANMETEEYGI
jgi:hypothetical protein